MEAYLTSTLKRFEHQGLYRTLRHLESAPDPVVVIDQKRVIQLSSNNYLGLANHPVLKQAARTALEQYGTGSGASRLITGNFALYEELEGAVARFKGTEAALVFATGYQANIGSISALLGPGDLIYSDALNHASIIDGCRLSGAQTIVYPHRDVAALEELLHRNKSESSNRLILTDGVFSMDGTIAPLPDLLALAKRYDCWLMVDDAHATGILGNQGKGTAEFFGLAEAVDIQMGTFSKALGSLGGYIAGSRKLKDFLVNSCRSLIYSTGLPPAVLAANRAALDLVENSAELRQGIRARSSFVREELVKIGYNTLGSETQIIPILIGEASLTMDFSHYLFTKGVFAHGIRPPTVPEGLSRVRISVMATHEWDDLHYAMETIREAGKRFGII